MFGSSALRKMCNSRKTAVRKLGPRCAKLLVTRLADLDAADTLEVMRKLPGRCHELKEDRAGQLALDLVHPLRLIFEPADDPIPKKPDGGLDWAKVRTVVVVEVGDYH